MQNYTYSIKRQQNILEKIWMIKKPLYLALLLIVTHFTGCGLVSSESMYEGVRSQQKANSGGTEPKQPILPTYQQYQLERSKLQ